MLLRQNLNMTSPPDLTEMIVTACSWEASATKPGNVHPGANFADLTYEDFLISAELIAPILAKTEKLGVGQAVLQSVHTTMTEIGNNTNLGIALLLAPLLAVPSDQSLNAGIANVLNQLTVEDAMLVYQAIQLARPSGMGSIATQDITQIPSDTLLQVMKQAEQRDAIAAEYANHFSTVLQFGYPFLLKRLPVRNREHIQSIFPLPRQYNAVLVELHVRLMARNADTLIARKCGREIAEHSAQMATALLQHWDWSSAAFQQELQQFDRWLRADGHKRNPGTTADLVAATLFAWLRERFIRQ